VSIREHYRISGGGREQTLAPREPPSSCAAYVSIRQHTSAYVSIRQHTSAYGSIRQHTKGAPLLLRNESRRFASRMLLILAIPQHTSAYVSIRQHTSAYVSIRHECSSSSPCSSCWCCSSSYSSYVSIRQHTSAYGSIRQHTSAYGSIRQQSMLLLLLLLLLQLVFFAISRIIHRFRYSGWAGVSVAGVS